MNQRDLLKWGLVALGVYLVYRYIEDHGGFSAAFGSITGTGTGTQCPAGQVLNAAGVCIAAPATGSGSGTGTGAGAGGGGGTTPPNQPPGNTPGKPPQVDLTGLTVVPDINDSLTGTIKIDGVPTKLSIISASGTIYDATGNDVTDHLQSAGVDLVALRNAFLAAPAPTGYAQCVQPNLFNSSGICVDAFSGQPVPNVMTQAQQNRGMAGLAAVRLTPYWLM